MSDLCCWTIADGVKPVEAGRAAQQGGDLMRLAGRRAVVTGGGRGIGAAIAAAFVAEGAQVVIFDRDAGTSAATAAAIGDGCGHRLVDVTNEEQVEAAFRELDAQEFDCDLLVNNAAVQREGALLDQT
ncbi:MAG TPA: SDR family NAD(P)-dependent oxidoreductase, partial [Candidatus Limnocylindrales bacterium]